MQEAGEGKLEPVTGFLASRLAELVAAEEADMANSWLERHHAPLRDAIPGFDERCLRAVSHAAALADKAGPARGSTGASAPASQRDAGPELWVETSDGLIGGLVDLVTRDAQGVSLHDYKSGGVLQLDGEVKADYSDQLKLYAAVYADMHGVWPTRLFLVPLRGDPLAVPFERDECDLLAEEARGVIRTIISAVSDAGDRGLQAQLARPSGAGCRSCAYRPICSPYWADPGVWSEAGDQMADLGGRVTQMALLENGSWFFRLDAIDGFELRLRGIANDPLRHPALNQLHVGALLRACNVRLETEHAGSATAMTVLYARANDPHEHAITQ
jgi:hypothetical protein